MTAGSGRRLTTFVHVHDEAGVSHVFGPDDKVPGWAAKAITAPVWDGDVQGEDGDVQGEDGDDQSPEQDGTSVPARHGKGSGLDAWRAYADSLGVEFSEDMGRDDLVAAVAAAGHPVE